MTGRIQEAPLTVRQAREYGRFLAMRATEDKPDKQGRITIPPLLKEYAGLDRDVVVIGALNRVEIWDPERIAAWEAEHSQTFADMSEDIFPAYLDRRHCSPHTTAHRDSHSEVSRPLPSSGAPSPVPDDLPHIEPHAAP